MRRWFGAWRRGELVVLAVGVLLSADPALATHGGVHGHCNADGKVVIEYGPPGWEEKDRAYCDSAGQFILQAKKPFVAPKERIVIVPPDDFSRWVNISVNRTNVQNPYDDVFPYIAKTSKRTLVPLRYLSEAFGAQVEWHADNREAVVSWRGRTITVPIGKDTAVVDGREVQLDQPAVLWNSRTMVPLRFLLEAVGATVRWDDVNSFVHITLDGAQCPPNYCPS